MKKLTLHTVETVDRIVTPDEFNHLTLNSPAIKVFTDYAQFSPLIIESKTPVVDAIKMMQNAHVSLKLVITEGNNFIGIVTPQDISEMEIIKAVTKGYERDQLLVSDFIQSRDDLLAFDFQELQKATISDVVHTLQKNGLQHCLVVEHKNHHIRGVISASYIAEKLHVDIADEHPVSFLEVFEALHN